MNCAKYLSYSVNGGLHRLTAVTLILYDPKLQAMLYIYNKKCVTRYLFLKYYLCSVDMESTTFIV